MTTFVIADTHFNDSNIINFENRPFDSLLDMNSTMIDNWNYVVHRNDTVYVLGDFGDPYYINKLNGNIILVRGNHDVHCDAIYHQYGFEKVYDYPIVIDDFFILSHEPMYVTKNAPYANIFGHVHNNPMYKTASSRSYCVSAERLNYTPIPIDVIKMKIRKADKEEND